MIVHAFEGVLCLNKPISMVCYKALCDVGQFYLLFNSLHLLVTCSLQMTDRTNKHYSTSEEEWGGAWRSIENLGSMDGAVIFDSWVKYGGNT